MDLNKTYSLETDIALQEVSKRHHIDAALLHNSLFTNNHLLPPNYGSKLVEFAHKIEAAIGILEQQAGSSGKDHGLLTQEDLLQTKCIADLKELAVIARAKDRAYTEMDRDLFGDTTRPSDAPSYAIERMYKLWVVDLGRENTGRRINAFVLDAIIYAANKSHQIKITPFLGELSRWVDQMQQDDRLRKNVNTQISNLRKAALKGKNNKK